MYFIKKYLLLLLLTAYSFLFFLIDGLFTIRFTENDDVIMALISSGSYSGIIDNHLVFINVLYGTFLNALYSFLPSLEWYTVIFIVINIASVSIISYGLLKSSITWINKIVFLLFLCSVYLQITADLQFTKTAAVAAVAGITLMYHVNLKLRYLGVLCFVIASLIRFEVAFLVLIITSPIFLIEHFNSKKFSFNLKTRVIALTVLLCLVCKFIDYVYYNQNQDWKSYSNYNSIRGEINDNPNARMLFYNLPEGVSKTDYQSILYFFPDPESIDIQKLKEVYDGINNIPNFTKIRHLFNLHVFFIPLALLSIIVLIFRYSKKNEISEKTVVVTMFIILLGTLALISFNAIVKYRVFFVTLVAFVFILPYFIKMKPFSKENIVVLMSLIGLIFLFNEKLFLIKKKDNHYKEVYMNQSNMLKTHLDDNDKKIVPFAGEFKVEYQNALHISSNFLTDKVYFGGWLTQIPLNKNKFDSFKYFADGYGLFVSRYSYELAVSKISSSLKLDYSVDVTPNIVAESNGYFIVEFEKTQN